MSFKEKTKTTQFKVFATMSLSTIAVVAALILINNFVLEYSYILSKIYAGKTVCKQIQDYYAQNMDYDIKQELRQIEIRNNIQILIEDTDKNVIYVGNRDIIDTVNKSRMTYPINSDKNSDRINIYKEYEAENNRYILLRAEADNDYVIYIKISINPIKESVRISNETLILLGILIIIIYSIVSSYISHKLTDPIVQMNRITKKMAKLDFSEKYEIKDNGASEDMNELGKNINLMSLKLESTIKTLRANNDELEKSIEEKSKIDEMRKQFISDVSHELKTPIGLIQGYAEGLLENVNDDPESRKFYAEVIIDEANKMDKMVKELLELMKLEYKERKFKDIEFDLNELIKEELRRETVNFKDKNITVEYDDDKPIKVVADQEYIEQVVNNYLTNAIKHCEKVEGEKKIIIRTDTRKDKKIRLYVYNTGERIPDENINKIWERFYKIDTSRNREAGGTGIGLALVKAIMNNYDNEYGVENLENGVEFYADINAAK